MLFSEAIKLLGGSQLEVLSLLTLDLSMRLEYDKGGRDMKIAMKRETLFVFDMTDKHRKNLEDMGFSHVDNDLLNNEIWEREEDYCTDEKKN